MIKLSILLSHICDLKRLEVEYSMQAELFNYYDYPSDYLLNTCLWSSELAPNSIHTPSNRFKMLNIGIIWHQLKPE